MRPIAQFVRFFGYGLLGIQLVMSLGMFWLGTDQRSDNMGPGFGNVFMALLWVPIGTVLSVAATGINRRVCANGTVVALIALASGVMFFFGILAAGFIGIPALFLILPPILHLLTAWSMRFFTSVRP